MRFLCLHGMGGSSKILEFQLASIRANLPGRHEFVFLDGCVEGDPVYGEYKVRYYGRRDTTQVC